MDSSVCRRAALKLRRTISSSFCGRASSDNTNLSASILTSEKAEADLVLHCLYRCDKQALSNGFARPAKSIGLNWPGELHFEAGLISGDQAAACPLVLTAAQLSTTEAATKLTAFLVVNTSRNHSTSLFIPLIFGTRNDHISSSAYGCKTRCWIRPQMSQAAKSRSPSDSSLGIEHYHQTL